MNRKWQFILVLMVAGAWAGRASLSLIAYWNFNSSTDVSGGSESSLASLNVDGANADLNGAGTGLNRVGSDLYGTPLRIAAGTAGKDGQYITFSLSMSGYQDLVLTYASARTSTGFTSENWSYSTDNSTFTPFSSITSIPTYDTTSSGYGTTPANVDFSSVTALNNDSSIWIRLTLNGATSTIGADRFDNIQFNVNGYVAPVPENDQIGLISGAALLALCGFQVWRQRRLQKPFSIA